MSGVRLWREKKGGIVLWAVWFWSRGRGSKASSWLLSGAVRMWMVWRENDGEVRRKKSFGSKLFCGEGDV